MVNRIDNLLNLSPGQEPLFTMAALAGFFCTHRDRVHERTALGGAKLLSMLKASSGVAGWLSVRIRKSAFFLVFANPNTYYYAIGIAGRAPSYPTFYAHDVRE